ncbi:MAG TPA: cardiolipin synthase [Crinalium sp.]|jgi:cardiolipin synthase
MLIDGGIVAFLSAVAFCVHALGIFNAAHAVLNVRSSQGAIAWGISLITFPWLALPLYWILGRNKFYGYAEALRSAYAQHRELVHQTYTNLSAYKTDLPDKLASLQQLAESFIPIPFTSGNTAELLINGEQTFDAMLKAIASAKSYILLQSYIINDDGVGRRFRDALIAEAQRGIRVYILYDEVGSSDLSRSYVEFLRQNNIQVYAFNTTKGIRNRFQINFRNHRKILVVDGEIAFVGGLNIGDEYLGKDPKLSPWRDTHMMMWGPSVKCLQVSFLQDWYWATREFPDVNFQVDEQQSGDEAALILPTGPADRLPACNLFFVNIIQQSQSHLWIASPYFVPDEATLTALKLAAMRGVDVRIILPNRPDHLFVYLCSFSYYYELASTGIKLYRYRDGFMHQKVILMDRDLAGVGTTNLDNRSFFLNFEVMGFLTSPKFIGSVEAMLLNDISASRLVDFAEYDRKPIWFRFVVRLSRLLTPLL